MGRRRSEITSVTTRFLMEDFSIAISIAEKNQNILNKIEKYVFRFSANELKLIKSFSN